MAPTQRVIARLRMVSPRKQDWAVFGRRASDR